MRAPWSRSPQPATTASSRMRAPVQRKPRILIAGEFSAGKTQLINGLVGAGVLPSNVTATALPPVWLVRGDPAMMRVGFSGRGEPLADLRSVDIDKTQYCVLSNPASVLTQMDIIDTPGSSDPNMAAETWQRMLAYADAVVWCTNATQAWRQSEKAVWQAMPARLQQNATLVVTHADLINGQGMADRVLQRVQREASAFFDTFVMASLLERNDLDRIAAHLRYLCGTLRLDGAANPLTGEFAAAHPVRAQTLAQTPAQTQTQAQPPAQTPAPRAASAPAAPASAAVPRAPVAPAPAPAQPAVSPAAEAAQRRLSGENVLHLIRPRRVAQQAPEPVAAPVTARASAQPAAPQPNPQRSAAQRPPAEPAARPAVPQPALARAPVARQGQKGIARMLWDELSSTIDRNDPIAVLAAVERLIGRVDAHVGASVTVENVPAAGSGRPAAPNGKYE